MVNSTTTVFLPPTPDSVGADSIPVEVESSPSAPPLPTVTRETRALWVVRFSMTTPESVSAMVEHAVAAGVNTLIVQVRGRADAFFDSALEPRGEALRTPAYDPLAHVIELAHARGLAVHAWVNTHLVWGPASLPLSADHILRANPDWLAVPRALATSLAAVDPEAPQYVDQLIEYARARPGTVEGVYTSPSHPAVHDRVHAVWLDLAARYDLDGIHFDYIRFPSGDFDYSLGALERFRLWLRPRIPTADFERLDQEYNRSLVAMTEGAPELWDDFRRDQVTALVRRIHRDVKAIKPDLTISAAVIADRDVAWSDRFQDWPRWLEEGWIDVVVPMAYTEDPARFTTLLESAAEAAGSPGRLWAGIGAYMNPAIATVDMIDRARAEGAGGIVLFSYDWMVGEGRGDPDDPYLQQVGRARFGR